MRCSIQTVDLAIIAKTGKENQLPGLLAGMSYRSLAQCCLFKATRLKTGGE
jgi:hypothetical protein